MQFHSVVLLLLAVTGVCVAFQTKPLLSTTRSNHQNNNNAPLKLLAQNKDFLEKQKAVLGSIAFAAVLTSASFFVTPGVANAISGGGLDYASQDIRTMDFSKKKLNEKDFSGSNAIACQFTGSSLRGARFFKADLERADYTGADLTGASFEGANLKDTILKDTVLEGAYFSETVELAADIRGADFTDANIRKDIVDKLCQRPDAEGENPRTGVDTRDSLLCG